VSYPSNPSNPNNPNKHTALDIKKMLEQTEIGQETGLSLARMPEYCQPGGHPGKCILSGFIILCIVLFSLFVFFAVARLTGFSKRFSLRARRLAKEEVELQDHIKRQETLPPFTAPFTGVATSGPQVGETSAAGARAFCGTGEPTRR